MTLSRQANHTDEVKLMLVLCSNGLSSPALLRAGGEKLSGGKTAALVVTADPEYKEQNYHVPRCVKELESLGLQVALFDLDKQPGEGLLEYDVVEFIGGNPFYLLQAVKRGSVPEILGRIARERMLIGWSAAAFVFGPTLELLNRYSPEMNLWGITDLRGLALTQTEVLPHYSRFLSRFSGFEETCRTYEAAHGVRVIRLNDGDGVLLDRDVTIRKGGDS